MTTWVDWAVLILVGLGMIFLIDRLRLLRPDSHRWRTIGFFAVFGVVLLLIEGVLSLGCGACSPTHPF